MKNIYENIPGYVDVKVISMRKGSVVVIHEVIFQTVITNELSMIEKQKEFITNSVKQKLETINSTQECNDTLESLCFLPMPNPVLSTSSSFSAEEYCKKISMQFADYYYANTTTGVLRCVSRCTKDTPNSINCFNGMCRISEIGPQCICDNLDTFLYMDSHCQLRIQKSALGLGLPLAVLFVVSIILTVLLIRAKRKKSRESWSVDAGIWYGQEGEEEWIPSGGLGIMNKASVSSWDEHLNQNKTFNPCLDSVDTSVQLHFQKPIVATEC
ncbi:mucin-12-like isoform X1 [Python bivittatus]|uniref:Mucin-12-like isoform X1 n=1 Tax=Python bivittatus TaxID=176946 RepID=A0A9F3W1L2_PYTBI|nr:mucin-12-like isoform X1 [Python bivittatus]